MSIEEEDYVVSLATFASDEDEKYYREGVKQLGHPTIEKLINAKDVKISNMLENLIHIQSKLKLMEYMHNNGIKLLMPYKNIYILEPNLYSIHQLMEFIKIAPHCLCDIGIIFKLNSKELEQILNYSLNNITHRYFLKYDMCVNGYHHLTTEKLSYLISYKLYKLMMDEIPIKNTYHKPEERAALYVKYNFIMQFLSTYKKMGKNNNTIIARFYKSPIFNINILRVIFRLVLG